MEQRATPAADITESEWDRVVDTNLQGAFLGMKHQIPQMLERGGPSLSTSSTAQSIAGSVWRASTGVLCGRFGPRATRKACPGLGRA